MIKLWLDDVRDPRKYGAIGFAWAKDYNEAVALIKTGEVSFASLDHDIGACEECVAASLHIGDMESPETTFYNHCPHAKSGYDFLCFIEESNLWPSDGIRVHSMNPVGRQRMQQVIESHYRREAK